jgi:DNA-binding response OmpR family regulator
VTPTGKILIVSAESGVLGETERMLKQAGCEIIAVVTGQECLAIALSSFPDLVLLDTVLPDVDCVEVCRKIKADPALAGLFVILMSASQTAPDQLCHGLESGADGYFTRPISDRELIARVQALLRMRQKQEALRQSEKRYRDLLNEMPDGYAHCRMVFDHKERPVDFYYLDVNQAFEKMTGLKNVVGRPKSMGFKVLEAQDGGKAVEVFQKHKDEITFVLCELTMPVLDGWGTIEALRHIAPGIPIILASGYSEAQAMAGQHPELPQAF